MDALVRPAFVFRVVVFGRVARRGSAGGGQPTQPRTKRFGVAGGDLRDWLVGSGFPAGGAPGDLSIRIGFEIAIASAESVGFGFGLVAGGLDELAELVLGDFGGRERVGFRQSEAADGHVRFDRRIARPREDLAKLPRRD